MIKGLKKQLIIMRKSSKPLVSIIVNCFNGDKYLSECLRSIKNQTYKNWELIFWDNKSTDKSKKIFINNKNNKMKYYSSPRFLKLHQARNVALKKTKGNLICYLDVDDIWLPNKLLKQIKIYLKNKDAGIIYGNFFVQNENTFKKKKIFSKNKLPEGNIFEDLLNAYVLSLSSIMFNKLILKKYKLKFDERYEIISDFDLCLKIASLSKIYAVQEPISVYRVHGDNFFLLNKTKHINELYFWIKNLKRYYKDYKKFNLKKLKNKIHLLEFQNKVQKLNFLDKMIIITKMYKYQNLLNLLIYAFLPNFIVKKFKFFE